MSSSDNEHATRLLQLIGGGDPRAAAELFPLVYEELHRLAGSMMREQRQDHTLQPTALARPIRERSCLSGPTSREALEVCIGRGCEPMLRV
jgi:hypothetical protein